MVSCINLLPFDGKAYYFSNFLSEEQSLFYFNILKEKVQWNQPSIKLFGKTYLTPRLTAWYGDKNAIYSYSGVINIPKEWFEELKELKSKVEEFCQWKFNSVLINWYRNEKDSMGWHADDESELGENPAIASISLGATRKFIFRYKINKSYKINVNLANGSLLIMKGETQHFWQHSLPKQSKVCQDRINLTFRKIML